MKILAYIIIGIMYWALATYSIWFLFFSNERIFNIKPMGTLWKDKESRAYHVKRRAELIARRNELQAELNRHFSQDKYREINIINHHIAVCDERIDGVWQREEQQESISVNNQKNFSHD